MSEPFLAEIRMFGFNFAPRGYAFCDGQLLPINQNQSLFSLLGTTYGGDGRTTFALPELRGRAPLHTGNSGTPGAGTHLLGQRGGEASHTLSIGEVPAHDHALNATAANAAGTVPDGAVHARAASPLYGAAVDPVAMHAAALASAGAGQAHDNAQPSLTISFCIALQGLFPPRN